LSTAERISPIEGRASAARAPYDLTCQTLIADQLRKYPPLEGIKIDYSWWGWVGVSHDFVPRIVQPDPGQSIFYALGYGGDGVMYPAQAGRRMAQMIARIDRRRKTV